MNQREGVFMAVETVLNGEINGAVTLDDTQKKQVYAILFSAFKDGTIEYKGGVPADDKLSKYIPGLVNNWLRKDPALNGGTKYVTKKPGSRAGSGDETLKAMRLLLSVTTDAAARAEIESAIKSRQSELKPKVEVNVEALPPELRKYIKS